MNEVERLKAELAYRTGLLSQKIHDLEQDMKDVTKLLHAALGHLFDLKEQIQASADSSKVKEHSEST